VHPQAEQRGVGAQAEAAAHAVGQAEGVGPGKARGPDHHALHRWVRVCACVCICMCAWCMQEGERERGGVHFWCLSKPGLLFRTSHTPALCRQWLVVATGAAPSPSPAQHTTPQKLCSEHRPAPTTDHACALLKLLTPHRMQ